LTLLARRARPEATSEYDCVGKGILNAATRTTNKDSMFEEKLYAASSRVICSTLFRRSNDEPPLPNHVMGVVSLETMLKSKSLTNERSAAIAAGGSVQTDKQMN
jgi:hypothetical protein